MASVRNLYRANQDYYFAKNIDTNQYIKVESQKETDIFEDDIFTVDLEKLKPYVDNKNNNKNAVIFNYNEAENAESVMLTTEYIKKESIKPGEIGGYSSIFRSYYDIVRTYEKVAEEKSASVEYALVDINNDKIKELIINYGTCDADYKYNFYSYRNGTSIDLGAINSGNSALYKVNDEDYLKQVYTHGGAEVVYYIAYENDKLLFNEISSGQIEQEDSGERESLITFIDGNLLEPLNDLNKMQTNQ